MKDCCSHLVLLEYLAVRKCHRLAAFDAVGTTTTTATTTATSHHNKAYHESLVKALQTNASTAVHPNDDVLGWLQRILETLLLDSYRASRDDRPDGNGRTATVVDQKHVIEAIQALQIQCDPPKDRLVLSKSNVRWWRNLLQRHVARNVLRGDNNHHHHQKGRWRSSSSRRTRLKVSDRAIHWFQRLVSSLLCPNSVRLYSANDGCQISFRSSCGTFQAHYFEFYRDDDEDEHLDDDETSEEARSVVAVGKWIGAVINCHETSSSSNEIPPMARRQVTEARDGNDGSTLDSALRYYDREEDDDADDDSVFSKRGGSDQEMSTASMTSSLSTTSSSSSSSSHSSRKEMGLTTPLLSHRSRRLASDDTDDAPAWGNGDVQHPPRSYRRLALPALLLASAKVTWN